MAIPIRVHQTTTTTGTGTYSLTAATSQLRNFNDIYSTSNQLPYCTTSDTDYEIGIGTLTTGSPDTISRNTIILSSNSNTAVDWASGVKDIFAWDVGTTDYCIIITYTSYTILPSYWGETLIYTGSANGTFTLPQISTIPMGFTITIKNSSSYTLTVDPYTGDEIESLGASTGYIHTANTSASYSNDGTVWRQVSLIPASPISDLTTNTIPVATSTTTIGNSLLTDDGTTLNYTGTDGFTVDKIATSVAGSKIKGITSGSAVSAGYIGELISSVVLAADAIPITSKTSGAITSIDLTAGIWLIWGNISPTNSASGVYQCAIYTTSGSLPDLSLVSSITALYGTVTPQQCINLSTDTTYYLNYNMTTFVSTLDLCGGLYAIRIA